MRKRLILGISLVVFTILLATAEAGASVSFKFGVPPRRYPHAYVYPRSYVYPRPFYVPRPYITPYSVWVPGRWYRTPWGWQYAPGYWMSW